MLSAKAAAETALRSAATVTEATSMMPASTMSVTAPQRTSIPQPRALALQFRDFGGIEAGVAADRAQRCFKGTRENVLRRPLLGIGCRVARQRDLTSQQGDAPAGQDAVAQSAPERLGRFFRQGDAAVHPRRHSIADAQDGDPAQDLADALAEEVLLVFVRRVFDLFEQVGQVFGELLLIVAVGDKAEHAALHPDLLGLTEAGDLS